MASLLGVGAAALPLVQAYVIFSNQLRSLHPAIQRNVHHHKMRYPLRLNGYPQWPLIVPILSGIAACRESDHRGVLVRAGF